MPGVLIIEGLAQTAGALCVHHLGATYKPQLVYFMGIDRAKFRKPVLPGDQLHYHVKKIRSRGRAWRFSGEAKVNGQVVAEAEISAMILDQDDAKHLTRTPRPSSRMARSSATMCEVGPFCVVGPHVVLGAGVKLISHVSVTGRTTIGAGTRMFPFASLGSEPQDLKYKGEHATLEIGAHCPIREGVTMNPGTAGGGSMTTVGDKCTFLAHSHVAHDCQVGNNVIFSNNVMLAGHCTVGDFAILGGGAGVHPVRAHRASCLHRRHVRRGERPDPLRHGARQPRRTCRA